VIISQTNERTNERTIHVTVNNTTTKAKVVRERFFHIFLKRGTCATK